MTLTRLVRRATAIATAAPSIVWDAFTDVASWPSWSTVVVSVASAPERWEIGARVAFTLRVAGARVPFDVRVDACEPPTSVTWSSVRWTVTGTRTHRFEPTPEGGTRLTDLKTFEHAFWPIAVAYPRGAIDRMSRTWIAELAREADRRAGGLR